MPAVSDPARIPFYMAASTVVLALAIWGVAAFRAERRPSVIAVFAVAAFISVVGIAFAKFGANFGLPWQAYYTAPMLATVLGPPIVFQLSPLRGIAYVVLAGLTAPAIHAAFFYGLGWGDYMPFLALPR